MISKKQKLPKKDWVKGKSKFYHVRQAEEQILKIKEIKRLEDIYNKLPWFKKKWLKIVYAFRRIFAKIKKR